MRAAVTVAATTAVLVGTAKPAVAASPTASARLQGQFRLTGTVTSALHVPGERRGNRVVRTWTFTPSCRFGACSKIVLVRSRAHGFDHLVLHRHAPGYYSGKGIFDAPARCSGRTYPRGEAVPFKITVRITATMRSGAALVASAIKATYRNRSRVNRTPCVRLPAHDAAKYRGRLVTLTPPTGTA